MACGIQLVVAIGIKDEVPSTKCKGVEAVVGSAIAHEGSAGGKTVENLTCRHAVYGGLDARAMHHYPVTVESFDARRGAKVGGCRWVERCHLGNLCCRHVAARNGPAYHLVGARECGKHLKVACHHVATHVDVVDASRCLARQECGPQVGSTSCGVYRVDHKRRVLNLEQHVADEQVASIVNEHVVAGEIARLHLGGQSDVALPLASVGAIDAQVAVGIGIVAFTAAEIQAVVQHCKRAVERAIVLLLEVGIVVLHRAQPVIGNGHTCNGCIGVVVHVHLHDVALLGAACGDAGDGESAGLAHAWVTAGGSGGHAPVVGAGAQQRHNALQCEVAILGLQIGAGLHHIAKCLVASHFELIGLGTHIANHKLEVIVNLGTILGIDERGLRGEVALRGDERSRRAECVKLPGLNRCHSPVEAC